MYILVKIGSFQIKQNVLNLKSTLAVNIFLVFEIYRPTIIKIEIVYSVLIQ